MAKNSRVIGIIPKKQPKNKAPKANQQPKADQQNEGGQTPDGSNENQQQKDE